MSKSDTVKVKFLRSHPSYGHFAGEEAEISRADFEKYSQDGPFFEELKAAKTPDKAPEKEVKTATEAPETPAEAPEKAPTKGVKARAHTR